MKRFIVLFFILLLTQIPVQANTINKYNNLRYQHNPNSFRNYNTVDNFINNIAIYYYNKGINEFNNRKYMEAIIDFNMAETNGIKSFEMYKVRGMAECIISQYNDAISDLTKAINIKQTDSNLYFVRAFAEQKLQYYKNAIIDYTNVIKLDPNNSDAYNNRGIIKEKFNDYNGAIEDYKQAIGINSNNYAKNNLENLKQRMQTQINNEQTTTQMNNNDINKNNSKSFECPEWIKTIFFGCIFIYAIGCTADWLDGLYTKDTEPYQNNNLSTKVKEFLDPKIAEERKRKRQQTQYWKEYWENMSTNGFKFENEVGKLYKQLGYKVTVTKGTGDGGVDLILKKDDQITIVQCKAHKHQVGPNDVRALWGVMDDFKANSAIFIAYSGVTQGARDFAFGKKLKILDVNDLIQMSLEIEKEKNGVL